MLCSVALRYLVDESIYMHQVHVNISITGCGNRYLSICTLMIAHYCTLSLSAIWMAKMCATWHLKYRIQCRCTLSPCQPSSQPTITTNHHHLNISITGSSASLEEPSDACHSLVPWLCKTTTSQVPKNISITISDNFTPKRRIKVPPQVLSELCSHRLRLSPRSNWRATHFTATAGKNNIIS